MQIWNWWNCYVDLAAIETNVSLFVEFAPDDGTISRTAAIASSALDDLTALTVDNGSQQARLAELRGQLESVTAGQEILLARYWPRSKPLFLHAATLLRWHAPPLALHVWLRT